MNMAAEQDKIDADRQRADEQAQAMSDAWEAGKASDFEGWTVKVPVKMSWTHLIIIYVLLVVVLGTEVVLIVANGGSIFAIIAVAITAFVVINLIRHRNRGSRIRFSWGSRN
jgi:hypothetical protein